MRKQLIAVAAALVLTAAGAAFLALAGENGPELTTLDNKSTQVENSTVYEVGTARSEQFEELCESETHELYLNEATLGIQVVDKKTGFVYTSAYEDTEGLNETWSNFMFSGVTIEYADKKNKVTRKPLTLSDASIALSKRADGFDAKIQYVEAGISLQLSVTLDGSDIIVTIPKESIQETGELKLQNIYLYPFLGATKGIENNGYFFVPDGCGALIRTNQEELLVTSPYVKRVYGSDYGMGDYNPMTQENGLVEAEQIYLPVYGIILQQGAEHGQGFAVVLEKGEEYADLEAYISGLSGPYNFMTQKFVFRQIYKQAVDQNGTVMLTNQEKRNVMDIAVRYHFLTGEEANYTGIASYYRNYLMEQGVLKPEESRTEIPMKLEFLGAELERGMFGYSTVVMTKFQEMQKIAAELREAGIKAQTVVVSGYGKEGASGSFPSIIRLNSKLGSQTSWDKFVSEVQEHGGTVELYMDVMKAYDTGGSYSQGKDVLQQISKELVKDYYYNPFYYLGAHFTVEQLIKQGANAGKYGVDGIAVQTSGTRLFSNWNKKNAMTRNEVKEAIIESAATGISKSFYAPNSYLFGQTKAVYDIPMESSQYLIFTDTVPFLQMVLKGSLPYYAPASNFNADAVNEQLKKIEYGAYPAYYLTMEDPIALYDTTSAWLFTSSYEAWKEPAIAEYHLLNEALTPVEGAYLISHTMVSPGVAVSGYSNGIKLAVNYNETAVSVEGVTVKAKSFAVIQQP